MWKDSKLNKLIYWHNISTHWNLWASDMTATRSESFKGELDIFMEEALYCLCMFSAFRIVSILLLGSSSRRGQSLSFQQLCNSGMYLDGSVAWNALGMLFLCCQFQSLVCGSTYVAFVLDITFYAWFMEIMKQRLAAKMKNVTLSSKIHDIDIGFDCTEICKTFFHNVHSSLTILIISHVCKSQFYYFTSQLFY